MTPKPSRQTDRLPGVWPLYVKSAVLHAISRASAALTLARSRTTSIRNSKPSSQQTQKFLDRAIGTTGKAPQYLICDKDSACCCASFKKWCRRRVIRARFGKVAQHGSVAIVERFIKSLKYECTRLVFAPLRLQDMRREPSLYMAWFNEYRPHRALGGATPREVDDGSEPANTNPRVEPRERWPKQSRRAEPQTRIAVARGAKLVLTVGFLEGRKHLPIVELKKVA
ncbi:MAG: integrase core domain-containing protein [Planctomycetota bacterium]